MKSDGALAVVTNAIAFAMFHGDGMPVELRDGIQTLQLTEKELERVLKAAERVLCDLGAYLRGETK